MTPQADQAADPWLVVEDHDELLTTTDWNAAVDSVPVLCEHTAIPAKAEPLNADMAVELPAMAVHVLPSGEV